MESKDRPSGPEDIRKVQEDMGDVSSDPNQTVVTHNAFDKTPTPEEVKSVQQLAATSNDPNLTITSAPHCPMNAKGELPKEPLTYALENAVTVTIWTFLENLKKFGFEKGLEDALEWYAVLPDAKKYEMSGQILEIIETDGKKGLEEAEDL